MIPHFDPAPGLTMLRHLADECLEQHDRERAADRHHRDEPAAISALYDALACAREMLRHAKQHHELWQAAMDITTRVMQAAETAQPVVNGQYKTRYRRIRIAAAGLQVTIADKAAQMQANLTPKPPAQAEPKPAQAPRPAAPATITAQPISTPPQRHVMRPQAKPKPAIKPSKRVWM